MRRDCSKSNVDPNGGLNLFFNLSSKYIKLSLVQLTRMTLTVAVLLYLHLYNHDFSKNNEIAVSIDLFIEEDFSDFLSSNKLCDM